MDRVRLLSVFAGAGLMDLGFEQEGFDSVGAVEFEPAHPKKDGTCPKNPPRQWAVETWKMNRGGGRESMMCNRDVRLLAEGLQKGAAHVTDPEIRALLGRLHDSPPDVLIGEPPCQSFSLAGKRKGRYDPEKGGLAWVMIDIAALLRVALSVFENVEGLESLNGGDDFKLLKQAWRDAGYVPHTGTFNCADFGVPQTRKRVIIVAVREDVEKRLGAPFWPQPTHSETPGQSDLFSAAPKLPWVTVRQAIADLPEPDEKWYPLNMNDAERALGRDGGVREGSPDGLHEPEKPARSVRARKENYTPVPPNHTIRPPQSDSAEGHGVLDVDSPAPTIRAGGNPGPDGRIGGGVPPSLAVANHTAFVRLRPEQVERVLESGKFNPARDDRPSPTIKATQHKGCQNDEPYIIENHGPKQYLTADQVDRVMKFGLRQAHPDRPAPTVRANHTGPKNDEAYIVETNQTSRNGPSERTVDEPASAIDTRCDQRQLAVSGVRLRRLTPRECARLQSVPDDYVFHGPLTATYRQIGNGVPVLFARHLARAVKEYLSGGGAPGEKA